MTTNWIVKRIISPARLACALAAILLTACSAPAATVTQPVTKPQTTLALVPAAAPTCTAPAALTPALTEGPYYKTNSPERTSLLETDTPGTRLVLTGYVLTPDCQPVAGAFIDFWQADANGVYDNAGYTLRGHQFSDAQGAYSLTTVVPGLYTGRTEHIHVKVQAPGGAILTTQLFFPGVTQNETDRIFNLSLVLPVQETAEGQSAVFNFIVSPP